MSFFVRSSSRWPFAFGFLLVSAALLAATLGQKNPPVRPADADSPVLIWDIDLKLANALPRNFRTTDDPLKPTNGETPVTSGLSDLRASGSGEFTPEGLKLLLARMRGPVTVFDLRQETHLFVNNLPVSWYASRDWANVGRSQSEVEADETARVVSLKPGSKVDIRPGHPVKHGNGNSVPPRQVTVERASIERDVVQCAGASYVRITVTDHARPLDDEVDRFILAVRALSENAWAHFHCEAGLGRTTTFMVLYDMLRNADRLSLDDIVGRQKILSHAYDVLQPDEPGNWKAPYAAERAAFVRAFYDYARANPNGRPLLWSEFKFSAQGLRLCSASRTESDAKTHRTPKALRAKSSRTRPRVAFSGLTCDSSQQRIPWTLCVRLRSPRRPTARHFRSKSESGGEGS